MKRHKTLKLRHTKEVSEFIPMVAWLGLRNGTMRSLSQAKLIVGVLETYPKISLIFGLI